MIPASLGVNWKKEFKIRFDVYPETVVMMTLTSIVTSNILIGSSVVEPFRRHPAMIAQTFLTLDNLSKGRVILGIGAGEAENTIPYGLKLEKPASRLREAIKIIRLFWEKRKISYDGNFWKLENAVIAFPPYREGRYPPIWVGAHKPKTLRVVAELGDGWLPANLPPDEYEENLKTIKSLARKFNRNPEEITPALFICIFIDKEHEECHQTLKSDFAKAFALWHIPVKEWKKHGFSHPLGEKFYSWTDYIPEKYPYKEVSDMLKGVPEKLLEEFYIHGTADEVIKKLEEYVRVGLKHVLIWNLTATCNYHRSKNSFKELKKVLGYIKG